MCCSAGIRQGVKKTFTSFKAAYSTILKYTYLHQDYKIHRSDEIKSEHFSILLFVFSLFFTEKTC